MSEQDGLIVPKLDQVTIVQGGLGLPPRCQDCAANGRGGVLLPLSDYGQDGSSVLFKAWACSESRCGWSIRVDKGQVTYDRIESLNETPAGLRAGRRA